MIEPPGRPGLANGLLALSALARGNQGAIGKVRRSRRGRAQGKRRTRRRPVEVAPRVASRCTCLLYTSPGASFSDGQRFVVLRATAALRAAHGKTVTVARDAKGRLLVRPDPGKDIGS